MTYRVIRTQREVSDIEYGLIEADSLSHHGILGMKWGVRRYQNEDGSLTPAGKIRYGVSESLTKAKEAHEARVAKKKADNEIKIAKKKAEKEDLDKRKAEAKKRKKLTKMDPSLLSDQELRDLNNRKKSEEDFAKNYPAKGKKKASEIKTALIRQVVTPTLVAAGKSFAISIFSGKEFEDIMSNELNKAFKLGSGNDNSKKDIPTQTSEIVKGKAKKKKK